MTRLLRNAGFGLVGLGLILLVVWAVEPLRAIWPWIRGLPLVVRVGVGAAAIGLAVLLGSLIAERVRERGADKALLDEL
jgi:ABC-type transport system involved in cytochrome c biogenesis permease subunit